MTEDNDKRVKIRADDVTGTAVEWGIRAIESPSDCDPEDAAEALREAARKVEVMGGRE